MATWQEREAARSAADGRGSSLSANPKRVLLVDHDEAALEQWAALLEARGFEVEKWPIHPETDQSDPDGYTVAGAARFAKEPINEQGFSEKSFDAVISRYDNEEVNGRIAYGEKLCDTITRGRNRHHGKDVFRGVIVAHSQSKQAQSEPVSMMYIGSKQYPLLAYNADIPANEIVTKLADYLDIKIAEKRGAAGVAA